MRVLSILSLFALVCFTLASEDDEHVIDLTQENFESHISENEMILVKFYAPWCGHCKSLAPEYAKAAKMLKEEGSNVRLGKVDATVHTELATKFKVQGYPTLKFFKNGVPVEYNGPRVADGIIAWIKKKSGPAMVPITAKDELDKMQKEHAIVAVLSCKDESSNLYKTVSDLASKLDFTFAVVKDDALAKELGLSANQFVLFKQFDDAKVVYDGKIDLEELEKFCKLEKVPLVTEFSQETASVVFESDIKTHVIAFSGKKSPDYAKHVDVLKKVAVPLKGKVHVVIIDMDDSDSQRVGEFFSVTSSDTPTFRILKMDDEMVKFHPGQIAFESDAIIDYTKDVLSGKIKPHLKSQDEPEDWDKEPVKVLVAKTFKERAVIKDKMVFVEFYAPWCGHCKALTPIWDELAKHFEDNKDVVIAKCDATENEFEDIKIGSFPTLKFSAKGSTEFVDYKGDRKKEDLIKFIDSNGKVESSGEDSEKHDEL